MKEKKIAFVGLGRMGANMARCLHDKGYDIVALFDIQPAIAQSLAEELEATAVDTLAEISPLADVIFTVVTNDAAMESIFFGDDYLLQQVRDAIARDPPTGRDSCQSGFSDYSRSMHGFEYSPGARWRIVPHDRR